MAEKTKKKAVNRKNLLYALWVVALVAVMATAIIVVASLTDKGNHLIQGGTSVGQSDSQSPTENSSPEPEVPEEPDAPTDGSGDDPSDQPVSGKVTFIMPCAGATVIKSYTENTLVFNSTLGAYMGHMGIDFAASEGAEVVCVYDGVIESITTSYLTGTTVTVDHGNNLKTVYNSVDANEALFEGATVKQGDVIGYVSTNNLQEYKDGPHLHFEVHKGGQTVNPDEYLIGEEK